MVVEDDDGTEQLGGAGSIAINKGTAEDGMPRSGRAQDKRYIERYEREAAVNGKFPYGVTHRRDALNGFQCFSQSVDKSNSSGVSLFRGCHAYVKSFYAVGSCMRNRDNRHKMNGTVGSCNGRGRCSKGEPWNQFKVHPTNRYMCRVSSQALFR